MPQCMRRVVNNVCSVAPYIIFLILNIFLKEPPKVHFIVTHIEKSMPHYLGDPMLS